MARGRQANDAEDEYEDEEENSDVERVPTEVCVHPDSPERPRKKNRVSSTDAEENARLRAQLSAYQRLEGVNPNVGKKKKGPKSNEATEMEVLIKDTLRESCWRSIKFVTSQAQLVAATAKVLDTLCLADHDPDNPDHAPARQIWIERHTEVVSKALNDVRSYVQTRMRDVAKLYMDANGGKLPKKSIIEKFTRERECNMDDHDEAKVILWWVDKMLPKATANTHHFGPNKRFYAPISRVKTEEKLDLPPGTEAFAFLMYENCWQRWQYMWQMKKKHPGKRIITCKSRKEAKVKQNPRVHFVYSSEVRELKVPWTLPDIGQAKYGGWKPEAIKHWVTVRKDNQTARIQQASCDLELKILETLRTLNGISMLSPEEQKRQDGGMPEANTADYPEIADVFDEL